MTRPEKLKQLRQLMAQKGLDAYVIPNTDPHQSEYLADYWKSVGWLTGFTGSAANVVVTTDHAGLWTDSRYFIQAEAQLKGSGVELFRLRIPHTPGFLDWLAENLPPGSTAGLDGRLFSLERADKMRKRLHEKNILLDTRQDLIAPLWQDRPPMSTEAAFEHELPFAGKSRAEKLGQIREEMKRQEADWLLLSALDDIAWTFNLRGNDIAFNPVVFAYALIGREESRLFIDEAKLPPRLRERLQQEGVYILPYDRITHFLQKLEAGQSVVLSPGQISVALAEAIPEAVHIHKALSPATRLKACKNPVEQTHIRNVMVKDGIALVHFLHWLETHLGKTPITERSAAEQLHHFRTGQKYFIGDSFDTIAGYGPHGAIVHYSATEESDATLQPESLFLLDSGGQYLDGTTDITRTIALGKPSAEMKRDFTLVLQGHIQLAMAIFPEGTRGAQLDVLARQPLWTHGINYGHGTGHGVGFFLNVHEGPQSISTGAANRQHLPLEAGMLTSNEPGIYREGAYGIRIENLVLTVAHESTDFGDFLRFETVTLCPIDLKLVEPSLLSPEAREWLNAYHQKVYEQLAPDLPEHLQSWLRHQTRQI